MPSPPISTNTAQQGAMAPNSRESLLNFRAGIIAEPFKRQGASTTTVLTSGTAYYGLVPLFAGELASGAMMWVPTAGVGNTLVKHSLWTKDGVTKLAETASDHTVFNGAGTFVTNFATAYTVPADDVYLLLHVEVTGTSCAGVRGSAAITSVAPNAGPGVRLYGLAGTSQTDTPAAPLTLAAAGANPALWFGIV